MARVPHHRTLPYKVHIGEDGEKNYRKDRSGDIHTKSREIQKEVLVPAAVKRLAQSGFAGADLFVAFVRKIPNVDRETTYVKARESNDPNSEPIAVHVN